MKYLKETIIEDIQLEESINENTKEKKLYLIGPMLQYNIPNLNNRVYPKDIIMKEFKRFNDEMVKSSRALMELSHPMESLEINPDRACARIVEMWPGPNNAIYGKALILNTDTGRNLKGLIEGGTKIGFSSDTTGSLREISEGIKEVQDDLCIRTVDVVLGPSINLMSDPIMESKEFIFESGRFIEINNKPKLNEKVLLEQFKNLLNHK